MRKSKLEKIGVLLMAYGSPQTLDKVEEFLTNVKGEKPSKEIIQEVKERYRKIGGTSPFLAISQEQAKSLEKKLNGGGEKFKVYLAMRHWYPTIEEIISQMVKDGVKKAVGLVLTPHYSKLSVGGYFQILAAAKKKDGAKISFLLIKSWYQNLKFLKTWAKIIEKSLADLPKNKKQQAVIFTAHSLPKEILTWGDPYPGQLKDCAEKIANLAGVKNWYLAYQSPVKTGKPWLGPNIQDLILDLSKKGKKFILAVPIGFVSDHLETLYDLDYKTKKFAQKLGVWFTRTSSLNTSPAFIEALAAIVKLKLKNFKN